jgi:hypothetical protein
VCLRVSRSSSGGVSELVRGELAFVALLLLDLTSLPFFRCSSTTVSSASLPSTRRDRRRIPFVLLQPQGRSSLDDSSTPPAALKGGLDRSSRALKLLRKSESEQLGKAVRFPPFPPPRSNLLTFRSRRLRSVTYDYSFDGDPSVDVSASPLSGLG